MSIELMLNAVNLNLVAFSAFNSPSQSIQQAASGQVFALFVITIAAAEVGVGLAIVLLIYRNSHTADLDELDEMKG
jgi:NADH:ubiquinone oxidoreductase subunit K